MPRRNDIETILIIGSGPIVIGQACEFDYSGSQACKVLREEGYRVILINSNPATIMTDREMADEIYIEPVIPESIEKILIREKVQAILPTVGGQTALNVALELKETGILDKYNVELIGADELAIARAENRVLFSRAMDELGYKTVPAVHVRSIEDAKKALTTLGLPLIIRPSFTLGGSGGANVFDAETYLEKIETGLRLSQIHEVIVEKSIIGWKEFELEVMKDQADNTVIICSIENVDPIGIHTGDSITVAPQQTLSDREYQTLRDMSIAIIKKIGVATGGANVQFAIHPENGEIIVIEMNPRVSRSSALASKATGFPIAKIAAKLAVGYTLPEIENDITRSTPACFEPSIDYVVVKIPRFTFEKFVDTRPTLGVQMQSIGETMAIGRTFQEAMQKAIRGLETSSPGFEGRFFSYPKIAGLSAKDISAMAADPSIREVQLPLIRADLKSFHYKRLPLLKDLFFFNVSSEEIADLSGIDPYFIYHLEEIFNLEQAYWGQSLSAAIKAPSMATVTGANNSATPPRNKIIHKDTAEQGEETDFQAPFQASHHAPLRNLKAHGFSDAQLAFIFGETEAAVREARWRQGIRPSFKVVDTCAGEFLAETPYFYSSYDEEDELADARHLRMTASPSQGLQESESSPPSPESTLDPSTPNPSSKSKESVVIIGGGPNRIGQGIEFDYMCVQASRELRRLGYHSVMINSNPETVSTDYDVSSQLFFEPLTEEDTLEVIHAISASGVIVHLGGQTSLNLSPALTAANIRIMGTQNETIRRTEDRNEFKNLLKDIDALQPASTAVLTYSEAEAAAQTIGYPLLLRPSFVLGGRAMRVVRYPHELKSFFEAAQDAAPLKPILIDQYLEGAKEIDVDLICDGENVCICGILEHIEEAGVHSGDSACMIPPQSISPEALRKIIDQSTALAQLLNVVGLMNIQFALAKDAVYFLEANPRGSRTIPFVAKATGRPWVNLATRVMMGASLQDPYIQATIGSDFDPSILPFISVKEAVLPFNKFPEEDPLLGPEMKSTGEVMGVGKTLHEAFYKTQRAANLKLAHAPDAHARSGILISLKDKPPELAAMGETLARLGYTLYATPGTHRFFKEHGIASESVAKLPLKFDLKDLRTHEDYPIISYMLTGRVHIVFNTPAGAEAERSDDYIRMIAQKQGIPVYTTFTQILSTVGAIAQYYHEGCSFPVYSLSEISNGLTAPDETPKQTTSPLSP